MKEENYLGTGILKETSLPMLDENATFTSGDSLEMAGV